MNEVEKILAGLVRVGTVTDLNIDQRLARVWFPEMKMSSDWLPVLINRDYIPDYDGEQHTEERSGGSGEAAFAAHDHPLVIKPWMPQIGDQVLTIYLPVLDADGFIVGGIKRWR